MKLNTLSPDVGSKKSKIRLGRGIGSGLGKTSGRGHKGQKARAGGYHKINFEGGQMPIQRRLPKTGFKSKRSNKTYAEITIEQLDKLSADVVDLNLLKEVGLVGRLVANVKIILSGDVLRPMQLHGLSVSKGAREAILKVGGSVEA